MGLGSSKPRVAPTCWRATDEKIEVVRRNEIPYVSHLPLGRLPPDVRTELSRTWWLKENEGLFNPEFMGPTNTAAMYPLVECSKACHSANRTLL